MSDQSAANDDPLAGLPPDLVRVLRDPRIRINHPGQRALDLVLYVYDNVPSNTASAMSVDDWMKAWLKEWQRANRLEASLEEIRDLLNPDYPEWRIADTALAKEAKS